jgi:HPt (histidine-containing phosphotransfer) domain-containing protein
MRLLYIEDDRVDQLYFQRLCRRLNVEQVDIAPCFSEAEDLISRKKYDLIISDYQIGLDNLAEQKTVFQSKPLVLLTGFAPDQIPHLTNLVGVYQKPISIDQMAQLLETETNPSEPIPPSEGPPWPQDIFPDEPTSFKIKMLETFLELLASESSQIRIAADREDFDSIARSCHQLKSSFRLLGQPHAARLLQEMENDCRNLMQIQAIKLQLPSLFQLFEKSRKACLETLESFHQQDHS